MHIHLIAVGTRMPEWINNGYQEYSKRLPAHCRLMLHEVAAGKRSKGTDMARLLREEGERVLSAIPAGSRVIALERSGRPWSTVQLAEAMGAWLASGQDVALLVGGPEGLDDVCLKRADAAWSLSPLTLPHPLVRVVLAEQLYRAWSILDNQPYHR